MSNKLKNVVSHPNKELQRKVNEAREQAAKIAEIKLKYGSVANYKAHQEMVKRGLNV